MSAPQVKYFLSGASGIRASVLPDVAALIDYRLLSMHKAFKGNTRVWCEVSNHPRSAMKEVMLDSGAFTAFMKKEKMTGKDLDTLIATYEDTMRKLNPKIQVWLINLDVIPGEMGRTASPQEIDQAFIESDDNFKKLKKKFGSRVLPVYHQTEGLQRLRDIASMADYIGCGFRQDFAESDRVKHAEEVLVELQRMKKRTHGLATTGYKMLARTAFDSVDSATWLYIAAMGGIMYINDRGEIDSTAVSSSSPRQQELRQHFFTLDSSEKALIESRAKDASCTMEQLQNDLSYRILFNAHQMREWLKAYRRPKVVTEGSLFAL